MSRAQELLDAATPLPWVAEYVPYAISEPDSELVVYAVNALPAYEAAVEALEHVLIPAEVAFEHSLGWQPILRNARAALARLRDEVPA